jgi:two-component system, OmpR family, phosphate regulon sensor histidine kinase PhoR
MLLSFIFTWPIVLYSLAILLVGWILGRYFVNKRLWAIIKKDADGLHYSKTAGENGNVEDILKQLLQKRSTEVKRLKQLETYREQYTGNVAHELRTPIFAIQGYIESIIDDDEMDQETTRHFLKNARKNIFRLEQIITDLDTIHKFESKTLKLKKSSFDLFELFQDVIDTLEYYAKENETIMIIEGTSPGQHKVTADRERILQVLVNLGMNSVKYGKRGGQTKFIANELVASISIEVTDNGMGISKSDLTRIFERFYRADTSRSRSEGGSGLGLAICKHIIDAHNKKIYVFSKINQGSVFSFQLDKSQ